VESATFYLCECFASLPGAGIQIDELTAAGGGSQSDAWVQLSADILGKPFRRLQVHEAGALGAAILAGTGSGLFPSLRAGTEAMVRLEGHFEPDPAKQRLYAEKFKQYQSFVKMLEKDIGKVR
jgi:sugar (pentulose or hexulose) kinase